MASLLGNFRAKLAIQRLADRDSARRQAFCFFDFNLKAEALILAALRLRWPRVRGNENGGNLVLCLPDVRFTQIIQDDRGDCRLWRKTQITRHSTRGIACRRR